MRLPRAQQRLFQVIREQMPIIERVDDVHLERFPAGNAERWVGWYSGPASEPRTANAVHIVFTLPASTKWLFVSVTDGDPRSIAAILAGLEAFEVEGHTLDFGHTIPLDSPYGRAHGRVGMLLAGVAALQPFAAVPRMVSVDGKTLCLGLVIFLDEHEMEVRRERGRDGLAKHIAANREDLVRFAADDRQD